MFQLSTLASMESNSNAHSMQAAQLCGRAAALHQLASRALDLRPALAIARQLALQQQSCTSGKSWVEQFDFCMNFSMTTGRSRRSLNRT
jgi:hypothetical protein